VEELFLTATFPSTAALKPQTRSLYTQTKSMEQTRAIRFGHADFAWLNVTLTGTQGNTLIKSIWQCSEPWATQFFITHPHAQPTLCPETRQRLLPMPLLWVATLPPAPPDS
jgi:hypothetical protein